MRATRWLARALASGVVFAAGAVVAADGSGLVLRNRVQPALQAQDAASHSGSFSPLRGRIALGVAAPTGGPALGDAAAVPSVVGARLLGDYYFSRPRPADGLARGFRATSGVLLGSRLGTWGPSLPGPGGTASVGVEGRDFRLLPLAPDPTRRSDGATTVPYVGVGYSDAFGKGRWGLSADLGLMALRPTDGLRLGRAAEGTGVDDALRELRLTPLLQLGVSYSF